MAPASSAAAVSVSLGTIMTLVERVAGAGVDADAPLMEAGVDSLGAVELRNSLQKAVGNSVALPSTLVFEHPTARELASALATSTAPTLGSLDAVRGAAEGGDHTMVLNGIALALPGGVTSLDALWAMSATGQNVVGGVPLATRWDAAAEVARCADDGEPEMIKRRIVHGGFVRGAERFDNEMFKVSTKEANAMDPQQQTQIGRAHV